MLYGIKIEGGTQNGFFVIEVMSKMQDKPWLRLKLTHKPPFFLHTILSNSGPKILKGWRGLSSSPLRVWAQTPSLCSVSTTQAWAPHIWILRGHYHYPTIPWDKCPLFFLSQDCPISSQEMEATLLVQVQLLSI